MKMKLGDMEMDSQTGIHYGGNSPISPVAPPPETQLPAAAPPATSETDGSLPAWSRPVIKMAGIGALVAATTLLVVAWAMGFLLALFPMLVLFLIAIGTLWVGRRDDLFASDDDMAMSEVELERRKRVAALLQASKKPLSVEELQAQLEWTDQALLSTLQLMLRKELLKEDLDLDSGHWVYTLTSTDRSPPALEEEESSSLTVSDQLKRLDDSGLSSAAHESHDLSAQKRTHQ